MCREEWRGEESSSTDDVDLSSSCLHHIAWLLHTRRETVLNTRPPTVLWWWITSQSARVCPSVQRPALFACVYCRNGRSKNLCNGSDFICIILCVFCYFNALGLLCIVMKHYIRLIGSEQLYTFWKLNLHFSTPRRIL